MNDCWVSADAVFDGRMVSEQAAVRVRQGQIVDLVPTAQAPHCMRHISGMISPGFVDLQVNGGGGVMVNTTPTAAGLATIAKAHRQFGTVAVLPTVITDHPDVLQRAADAALAAKGTPGILGLHIEGPHIALARRGTHAAAYVRPMEGATLDVVARLRRAGVRVMITLAPEAATSAQIAQLADLGARVSLGHTDCTAEDIQSAIQAGARCGTHLFNAMSPMLGRAPGAVGALINSDCHTGIICDGHHVADAMVGMAVRARPSPDRMFLVSDAMATVGGPKSFSLYGRTVTLDAGRLINDEGSLAGAHVTQAQGVRRLVERCGVELQTALRMATSNPATCLGFAEVGMLANRTVADVIVLDRDLAVQGTLCDALSSVQTAHAAN